MNNSILIYFILIFFILIKKKSKKSKIDKFSVTQSNSNNTLKIYPSTNFEKVKTDYKLILNITKMIPSDGKIEIEFPSGYDLNKAKIKETTGNNPKPLITGTNGSTGTFNLNINGNKIILTRKSDGEDWDYVSYCYESCSNPKPNKLDRSISGTVGEDDQGNKTCTIVTDKKLNSSECNVTIEKIYKKIDVVTINLTGIKNPIKGKTNSFVIKSQKNDGTEIERFESQGIDITDNSCPAGFKYNYTFCKTYNYQCHKKGASGDNICVNNKGETTAKATIKDNLKKSLPGIGKLTMASMPFGTILPFMGNDIPYGWFECNGENNTPDLRGQFLFSADSNGKNNLHLIKEVPVDLSGNYINKSDHIKLKEENIPNHNHTGKTNNDSNHNSSHGKVSIGNDKAAAGTVSAMWLLSLPADNTYYLNTTKGFYTKLAALSNTDGEDNNTDGKDNTKHQHVFETDETGKGESFEAMPPFHVVRYIIRLI